MSKSIDKLFFVQITEHFIDNGLSPNNIFNPIENQPRLHTRFCAFFQTYWFQWWIHRNLDSTNLCPKSWIKQKYIAFAEAFSYFYWTKRYAVMEFFYVYGYWSQNTLKRWIQITMPRYHQQGNITVTETLDERYFLFGSELRQQLITIINLFSNECAKFPLDDPFSIVLT